MGRSIATHSNALKNFYVRWMDEFGVEADDSRATAEFAWEDFIRAVRRMAEAVSDTFETPYEEEWVEDEVRLILSNGHAEIVVSEYGGMAAVGVVAKPRIKLNAFGAKVGEEKDPLSVHYCHETLIPALEEKIQARFQTFRAGGHMSNGVQVFHEVST